MLGAGGNTKKFHIPNLQKIDGVQVVSVANRSLESSRKAAEAFNIAKVTNSLLCWHFDLHTGACMHFPHVQYSVITEAPVEMKSSLHDKG